ncbi:hypothetical protein BFV94_4969 [Alteromonas macleodii]|uniref:Uncharacterized protein n=1 Tax=Alteromonas macleodii TaxID=28108 RepID=A0AB36FSB5_ALTMA|nr:hypothetical protein BFV94_4969 [Alteromonas macleodii]OES24099.1 hypothetical protein BFV93_4852 [Alteromonas macleodii]OES25026.1 hypothetical protein BFV95_4494 [Alteromonas macleodii]OES38706.1 hypothetical protein BFV96_4817 [Alteromonas macleodii]
MWVAGRNAGRLQALTVLSVQVILIALLLFFPFVPLGKRDEIHSNAQ